MSSHWIDVKTSGGDRFDAWLALPPRGRGPGLVLLQEIFGVNRHIRTVAEQYALDGFVVIAPDLFWRQQRRIELAYEGGDMQRARELIGSADPTLLDEDVSRTVQTLRARSEVTGKVGVLGYCLGGRLAYLAAARTDVDAASCFYGGGIQERLDQASRIRCPIQFHYGERDAMIPPDAVAAVREAMEEREAEVFVYPDADHGFNCWDRASYQQRAAALAHGRTLELFAQHLA